MWGVGLICEGLVLNSSERFGGEGEGQNCTYNRERGRGTGSLTASLKPSSTNFTKDSSSNCSPGYKYIFPWRKLQTNKNKQKNAL